MDPFISLAKQAVEAFVKEGKVIDPPSPTPKEFNRRTGVFVSLHKVSPPPQRISSAFKENLGVEIHPSEIYDGYQPPVAKEELRGCIGTYLPVRKNIAEEIIHNALDSATRDPRFSPVNIGELPQLKYSIDILSAPESVMKNEGLDPKRYGLIVSTADGRKGLLLPGIEGVETVEQQIEICYQKAGINPSEKITLQRFTVERHKEK